MNKFLVVVLSILGGVEVVFYIFTPVIIAALWISVVGLVNWTSYFIYGVGLLATLFRAIKIGFLNK